MENLTHHLHEVTAPPNSGHQVYSLALQIFLGLLIALIVVAGTIGNFVVIFAISTQRKLHSRANFLIA